MARLFITPREVDYISDITKEITKDIIGQVIYYYRPRIDLSQPHDVYNEMKDRVFDPPIEIDCTLSINEPELKQDRFGQDQIKTAEVYLHYRDLLDRNIKVNTGDFFQFGDTFFEFTGVKKDQVIFGQVEHVIGFKCTATQARKGIINKTPHGPTEEKYTDEGAVQETFVQQRGNGDTGDLRKLVQDGVLETPVGTAQAVRKTGIKSSFYGDDS